MTLFEYLAIAFSLVFSFSAMRLVTGLPFAIRPERRYWVHLAHVCVALVSTVNVFWIFWSYQDTEWTLLEFWLALAVPGVGYFCACALVPDQPDSVPDWRNYYYSVRRSYFFGITAWAVMVTGAGTVLLGIPWLHPARFVQGAVFVIGVCGATSSSERIHACIAAAFLVLLGSFSLTFALQPAPLLQ